MSCRQQGGESPPLQHLRTQVKINPRNLRAQMNSQNCFQNFLKTVSLHSPELLGSKASTTILTPWLLTKGPLDNCFLVQAGSHEGSLGFMDEVVEAFGPFIKPEPQDRNIATALFPNPQWCYLCVMQVLIGLNNKHSRASYQGVDQRSRVVSHQSPYLYQCSDSFLRLLLRLH